MNALQPCAQCLRHVQPPGPCPFCSAPLPEPAPGALPSQPLRPESTLYGLPPMSTEAAAQALPQSQKARSAHFAPPKALLAVLLALGLALYAIQRLTSVGAH